MDAAVAVAVGHVELALRPDREIRRPVERPTGLRDRRGVLAVVARVRGLVHGAERHQELALRRELPHGVVAVVRAVQKAVRTDGDAVRAQGELSLAPRRVQIALVVDVGHARLERVARREPYLAGHVGRGLLDERPVAHHGLAARLAVDRPRRTVVVGVALLLAAVYVRENAEAER